MAPITLTNSEAAPTFDLVSRRFTLKPHLIIGRIEVIGSHSGSQRVRWSDLEQFAHAIGGGTRLRL